MSRSSWNRALVALLAIVLGWLPGRDDDSSGDGDVVRRAGRDVGISAGELTGTGIFRRSRATVLSSTGR